MELKLRSSNVYFVFRAKEMLLSHHICQSSPFGLAFCASAMSGVVVCLVICPFDVATVRLYNQGLYLLYNTIF